MFLPSWVWNGSGLNGIGVRTFSPNSIESECKAYSLVFEPSLNMVYMICFLGIEHTILKYWSTNICLGMLESIY